ARRIQAAPCSTPRKVGAAFVEDQLLVSTGESNVGNELIGPGRLVQPVASTEVEQQPLQRKLRDEFPRVRNEIAFGYERGGNWQRRPLKPANCLDRNLRRVAAVDETHGQRRLTRALPCLARLGVAALREVDQFCEVVATAGLNIYDIFLVRTGRHLSPRRIGRVTESSNDLFRRGDRPRLVRRRRRELRCVDGQRNGRYQRQNP